MGTLFYKYMKINENTLNSLQEKYFYFSQPRELNDPFDGIVPINLRVNRKEIDTWCEENNIVGEAKKSFISDYRNGNLNQYANDFAVKVSNEFHILCLSTVWDESLLWAHYTDSYKGICIGYNTVYINNTHYIQLELMKNYNEFFERYKEEYLCPLAEIIYDKNSVEPYNMFKKNYDAIKKYYLHKEKKWSHEKEYRGLYFQNKFDSFDNKIYYKPNILKEIIFGYNVQESSILKLKNILVQNYKRQITFYRIKVNRISMNLEKEKIAF